MKTPIETLARYDLQYDQTCINIMQYLLAHKGERINENKLSLQRFLRHNKKTGKYGAPFSASTISRKARYLGQLEIIERGHDEHNHTWYSWK